MFMSIRFQLKSRTTWQPTCPNPSLMWPLYPLSGPNSPCKKLAPLNTNPSPSRSRGTAFYGSVSQWKLWKGNRGCEIPSSKQDGTGGLWIMLPWLENMERTAQRDCLPFRTGNRKAKIEMMSCWLSSNPRFSKPILASASVSEKWKQ